MKISVIIPIFNQEKWISRCIRSLLNQTMDRKEYQIIVIDDGSNDNSKKLVETFGNDLILLVNKINKGLPYSLNKGIKNSKSKYIVRVDSDDYVNSNFLAFLYEYIENNKYMDAVACDYQLVDDKENILERKNCLKDPIGCGIIFKSEHLFNIGLYDNSFLLNEEKEMRIRFEKKYNINRLEIPLYRYRRHTKNITNNTSSMEKHDRLLKEKHK
jgi:glycosyltransferase involved in cell wall biosynthesis